MILEISLGDKIFATIITNEFVSLFLMFSPLYLYIIDKRLTAKMMLPRSFFPEVVVMKVLKKL